MQVAERVLTIGQTSDGRPFTLPPEAVTETFAILAKRGVGKTYTGSVLVEELLEAALQVAVADPVGVWWGLRASADGGGPGLPIVVLGGDHGDLPLEPGAGELVADLIIDEGLSAVLDLSLMRKGEQVRFMTGFAERLYHRNRSPLHLVLDEADAFAPQRPMKGQERMLGAIEDLVRRGRARGIGVTLITQRAAVLNKDVLTQVEVLVALRTIAPQDREAVDAWVRVHGTPEQRDELMRSLPSLPVGTAWFWSPGWLDVFERVAVRKRRTFDSSATPAVGHRRVVPANLAPVDLEALREKVAAAVERAEAEDPKRLRQRIAELERRLAERPQPERLVERVEVPVLDPDQVRILEQAAADLMEAGDRIAQVATSVSQAGKELLYALQERRAAEATGRVVPIVRARAAAGSTLAPLAPPRDAAGDPAPHSLAKLGRAERSILAVLAQYPQGRTKTQVAILTGYAVHGGGFNNALSRLRTLGYLEGSRDSLRITEAGLGALGEWEPLPTGRALLEHWLGQLPKAERLILQALADAYPAALSKEEVAARTGYTASGGGFNNALSRLRTLELIEGRGELRASDALFGSEE